MSSEDEAAKEVDPALAVPDAVKAFIEGLYNSLLIEDEAEMTSAYEVEYPKLTSLYYSNAPWPSIECIAPLVEDDPTFLALYRDLAIRHMFAKLQPNLPTLQQKFDAWGNYRFLFDGILGDNKEIDLRKLPNSWTFDLLHEFVYQFQAFAQFRCKWQSRTDEEKELLRANPQAWSTAIVLRYLSRFIKESKITAILRAQKEGGAAVEPPTPLMKMLGYFSVVMQSRAHCLLGDYHSCLKVLDPIMGAEGDGTSDTKPTGIYVRVPICYVTLFYHQGFAQLMARRYVDAIATFQSALLFIFRNRLFTRGDQLQKWSDKLLALLAIVTSLSPGHRLEEQVASKLREKYSEKQRRMQLGEESAFEDTFSYACPKFVLAAAPAMDDLAVNYSLDAHAVQLTVFMREVKQQLPLPTIVSYLKLYSTIGIGKLARFRDVDESTMRSQLLSLKHKTLQPECPRDTASLVDGERKSCSDVHFFVAAEMAHVDDKEEEHQLGKFFIDHTQKLQAVVADVNAIAQATMSKASE